MKHTQTDVLCQLALTFLPTGKGAEQILFQNCRLWECDSKASCNAAMPVCIVISIITHISQLKKYIDSNISG